MAKIALISDTHIGIRSDSQFFHDYFQKSFDDFFFPYLKEQNIKRIIHLGDVVDRRKYINFLTLKKLRENVLNKLNDYQTDIILGNHDVYYKNTNEVNALQELIGNNYNNITVHEKPTNINIEGVNILLLPWICAENYQESMDAINNSTSQICMGHLELDGYEMSKGLFSSHGEDDSTFKKFDIVCSGHFHHRSTRGNIHYIGAFCEHTWSDYNDPRGFVIMDTETRELEFIQNPFKMFHMIGYNDSHNDIIEKINSTDYYFLKNSYVKVVCKNRNNPYAFDLLIDKLYEAAPADITVVEDVGTFDIDGEEVLDESQDTPTLLNSFIDGLTLPIEHVKVKKFMQQIYTEALSVQDKE